MNCLEIYIDDKKVSTIGVKENGNALAILIFQRNNNIEQTFLELEGTNYIDENKVESLKWLNEEIKAGQIITIKMVDSKEFDKPVDVTEHIL